MHGIMQLSGAVKHIRLILINRCLVQPRFRLPEHHIECNAPVREPLTQYPKQTNHFHLAVKTVNDLPLTVRAIYLDIPLPLLRLTVLYEGNESILIKRKLPIKGRWITLFIAALTDKIFFDVLLEALFFHIKI